MKRYLTRGLRGGLFAASDAISRRIRRRNHAVTVMYSAFAVRVMNACSSASSLTVIDIFSSVMVSSVLPRITSGATWCDTKCQ